MHETLLTHLAGALFASAFSTSLAQSLPTPDVIQFAADTFEVSEADYSAAILFHLQEGANLAGPTFRLSVTGGTATQGADFQIRESGIWPIYSEAGVSRGWGSPLERMDDGIHEPDETIELTLSEPGPNTVLGPRTKMVVTIRNSPPTFVLHSGNVEERFGGSAAQVIVERRGDREPAVSVHFSVASGPMGPFVALYSARQGEDFVEIDRRLHFASGESQKLVEVQVLDDGDPEAEELFYCHLEGPSPGAVIQQWIATWFIRDNEVPALYDVTQAGKTVDSEPFVLLTEGAAADAWVETRPSLVALPGGGHLISGRVFTHVNGVARPNLARLLADGNLDEGFVPSQNIDPYEISDAFSAEAVLPLRSGKVLLGLESGLRRLNRDGSEDQSFFPPLEPEGLRPIVELVDGSVFVTGGTDQILRLDAAGPVLDSVVIKELDGAGFTGIASANWMPDPAPGRFLIYGIRHSDWPWGTFRFFHDGSPDPAFTPFDGRTLLMLSDGRPVATGSGNGPFAVRWAGGPLDPSWLPPRLGVCHQAPGVLLGIRLEERDDRLWIENRFCSLNDLLLSDSIRELAFHLTAGRAPGTALQVGLMQTSFPWNQEPFFTLGFRRLGRSDAPATAKFTARVVTALSREVTVHTGTVSFAPLEVLKTNAIPVQDLAGPDFSQLLEVNITAAKGFEALPAPFTWGSLSVPQLHRVKRLHDGRVLLGGTGPHDATKLEYSSDLKTWHRLNDLLGGFSGPDALWLDTSATNAAVRYYRAVFR